MIRFIVKCHECDFNSGLNWENILTLDMAFPELGEMLNRGERGEMGFETWQLIGVELLDSK